MLSLLLVALAIGFSYKIESLRDFGIKTQTIFDLKYG